MISNLEANPFLVIAGNLSMGSAISACLISFMEI